MWVSVALGALLLAGAILKIWGFLLPDTVSWSDEVTSNRFYHELKPLLFQTDSMMAWFPHRQMANQSLTSLLINEQEKTLTARFGNLVQIYQVENWSVQPPIALSLSTHYPLGPYRISYRLDLTIRSDRAGSVVSVAESFRIPDPNLRVGYFRVLKPQYMAMHRDLVQYWSNPS